VTDNPVIPRPCLLGSIKWNAGHALGEHIRLTIEQAKFEHSERNAQLARQLLGDKFDVQSVLSQYRPGESA
jgi:hypothetical protein